MLPYISPFLVYIVFSLGTDLIPYGTHILYPIKTIAVFGALVYFRPAYSELRVGSQSFKEIVYSILIGIIVFIIWVAPEGLYPQLGSSSFNPFELTNPVLITVSIIIRLIGAVIVVPIFEELFWRSFLIRWIVNQNFKLVPIGTFTLSSFIITSLFFGFEHHRWLVGIFAGIIYNLLLYKYKNVRLCIISHATTNLCLGLYVLKTGQWSFW